MPHKKIWILFVVDPQGTRHAFEVLESEWNIDTVYARIAAATGIPVAKQELRFGNRVLRMGKKLTSYGVQVLRFTTPLVDHI